MKYRWLAGCLGLLLSGIVLAAGEVNRVALVIGNSAYRATPLTNPVNDAEDVANRLRTLGFQVIERKNLRKGDIGSTLREFRSKLSPGAVALVFYAGHGLQIDGENYLPAVDADINSEEDAPTQSLALKQVMTLLDAAKTRLNLVFLDACRNNPYANRFRSTERGLARVTAPSGTLISYATKPGGVSEDGKGRNGLYTSKLLPQMSSNLPIELALKKVVTEVKKDSNGKQEPWMEGSIEGDFCFGGCQSGDGSPPATATQPVYAPNSTNLSLDDLKKEQEARKKWTAWQSKMQADYKKIAAMKAAPDLRATAWNRFLSNYAQDNPFSQEDEQLRSQAQSNLQSAQQHTKAAVPAQATAQPAPTAQPNSPPQDNNKPGKPGAVQQAVEQAAQQGAQQATQRVLNRLLNW